MGMIKAFAGALGGTLADQWLDFYTIPSGLPATAALFAAVPQGQNAGRGSNIKGYTNIISNGSRIVVPEGYGLITMEEGRITGVATDAGGYVWDSAAVNSQSIFAGDGFYQETALTLNDNGGAYIGHFDHFHDPGHCTDFLQVFHFRIFHITVFLSNHPDKFIAPVSIIYSFYAFITANGNGQNHPGE